MTASFVDRYIAQSPHLIHKLTACDSTGRRAYYFVLVEKPRERAFLEAMKAGKEIDLGDYGKVIASCYGEQPDERVKCFLKETYNFDV